MSEAEAYYMDMHKGHFSQKLAEWAVSMMAKKDVATGLLKKIVPYTVEEVERMLQLAKIELPEGCLYDAWYLANMVRADFYGSSIEDNEHLVRYIKDVICDPDGDPVMVLACFRAKMDVKDVPIQWERFL